MASKAVKQYKSKNDKDGTDKNLSEHERVDETDLAASRQSFYGSENIGRKSTVCDALFAFGSMGTFVADIASDLVVSYQYYDLGEYWWFGLTLAFVLLASVTMQVFSAKWFHEDGKNKSWVYKLMHFLHLGPLVRYWRAFREGWKTRSREAEPNQYDVFLSEWRDISMLRLFEAFLESAPQLVLQLYILSYRRRAFPLESHWFSITAVAAACSLVSLAWAIVAYSKALRDLQSDKGSLSWFGFGFQIVWRLCMVASRVVALVVFASVYSYYLFIAVGVHWIIMTSWLICQRTKFCTDEEGEHPFKEKLFNVIIGFVYIFCFFNTKEGMTRKRLFLYYSIMLVENSLFVSMWYPQRSLYGAVALAAILIVWGGFVIGIISMIMYYKFYHPSLPGTGIFFQRMEFDVEGHRVYSVVCCCCCRIQSSDATEATCGTVVRWCQRSDGPALAPRPHPSRRSPRNRPPTPLHEAQPTYPPFELEVLPRQLSREFPMDSNSNRQAHTRVDPHTGRVFDVLVIGPGYNLQPVSNGTYSQTVPDIVVTAASPDILSPRDSVSAPAINYHHENDREPISDDEEVPMLVYGTKALNSSASDFPDGTGFTPIVDKHCTEPLSPIEVHDAINRILHHDVNKEEGTLEDDWEEIRPINYGTLSFGNRYSIVSDCISLSSDSRSSESLQFNEDISSESKGSCDNVVAVKPADEGICCDERDLSVKNGDTPSHKHLQLVLNQSSAGVPDDDPLFSVKDVKQRIRKRTGSSDSETAAHPSAVTGQYVVESIMDEPPSPVGTLIRSKEPCSHLLREASLERDEGLELETDSPDGSATGSPAGSTSESATGSAGNPVSVGQVTEVMSEEESSLQSPFSRDSKPKRHTFDFSEIAKGRPNRKSERRRRRAKRREFDNFVITSIKPGKFSSIRRSSERLSKIQEASEETIGFNSGAINHCSKEFKEMNRDKELKIELSASSEHDNETEDQDGTNSEPQSPNDIRKVREEYVKKRRLKRLLTRQLAPGKFSTVRRSYDRIPDSDSDEELRPEEITRDPISSDTILVLADKTFTKTLGKNEVISGDSAISNMYETSTSSPDIENGRKNVNTKSSSVARRHTFDFSSISIPSPNQVSCKIDNVIDINCLGSPPSPVWKIKASSVNYRKRRPKSDIYTRRNFEGITA